MDTLAGEVERSRLQMLQTSSAGVVRVVHEVHKRNP
jgi:hypothetical protein